MPCHTARVAGGMRADACGESGGRAGSSRYAGRPRREQMTPVYRGVVKPTTDGLTPVKFTFFEKSG